MPDITLLANVFNQPEMVGQFTAQQWQRLIEQGYQSRLLGRLYYLLQKHQLLREIPKELQWHLNSAYQLGLAHSRDMRIEVEKVSRALNMAGIKPTFLKGVAYDLADDVTAHGRVYADVDIYIDKNQLPTAEHLLGLNGWQSDEMAEYDKSYYRRWMHEIPPLVHRERGVTLDVHHNLLPLTCRFAFSSAKLSFEQVNGYQVLSTVDRVLHAVCHLFMESEFDKGARDLSDLDRLFRQHSEQLTDFWPKLLQQTTNLGVGRLVFYALRYCQRLFGTPVPTSVIQTSHIQWAPGKIQLECMDWLFPKALNEPLSQQSHITTKLAHFILYLRGHWLRMPVRLLVPHLLRKSWMSVQAGLIQEKE